MAVAAASSPPGPCVVVVSVAAAVVMVDAVVCLDGVVVACADVAVHDFHCVESVVGLAVVVVDGGDGGLRVA